MEDLTKEELAVEIRKIKDKLQNDFMEKLESDVDWLLEKGIKKEYVATNYERMVFNRIRQKLENMNKWF